jgi:response regulator RpfG family c-di-GMP phosphodiesterase
MNLNEQQMSTQESFIVCVDDDKDFLDSLRMSLPSRFCEDRSYNFLFLDKPEDALNVLSELVECEEEIALLMSDQMMPRMNGIEFLRKAKAVVPTSMRVLLTGHAGLESAVVAINQNVLDKYLTKPVSDMEDLRFTLKRLLNEFHLRNALSAQQCALLDVYEFGNILGIQQTLEDVLDRTVAFTADALGCERISIFLVEDGALSFKAGVGIPREILRDVCIPVGQKVSGRVLNSREPILVTDINEIPWLGKKINAEFKSFISVPVACAQLTSFDVPLGVINVTNKRRNAAFTQQNLETLTFIANTASIAINNLINRQKLEQSYLDTVAALIVALEARDPYTKGHSIRVQEYAVGTAQQLGLDRAEVNRLSDAAILHDIGKIGVRDKVLRKPDKLDSQGREEIHAHPSLGGEIVGSISSLRQASVIVRQHHERYDGQGYPDGLREEQIHLGARIMAVADAYDAMTSDRPYRQALDPKVAVEELLRQAGQQFDPKCVQAFTDYLKGRSVLVQPHRMDG